MPYLDELRKHIDTIRPVSDEAFALIAPHVELRATSRGENIVEQDKPCRHAYCIRSGTFRSYIEEDAQERTRWFAIEGDIFTSTYAMSSGAASQSSIESITKGEVWQVGMEHVLAAVQENAEWAFWLSKMLLDGLGSWEMRDRQMLSGDSYTRFRNFYTLKPREILDRIPLQHVASYLSITPQTLSVLRRRLINESRQSGKTDK